MTGDVRSIAEHEMEMVAHHGIATNLDGKEPRKLAQPIENPLLTMTIVLPGILIDAAEEGPSHASSDAVINTNLVFNDDLAPCVRGHQ